MRPPASRNDEAPRVRVTLRRSCIGYEKKQRAIVRGLGLRRIGQSVDVVDNDSTRGMIRAVRHLVSTEPH
jgi:large subunit ribosomal protein L30